MYQFLINSYLFTFIKRRQSQVELEPLSLFAPKGANFFLSFFFFFFFLFFVVANFFFVLCRSKFLSFFFFIFKNYHSNTITGKKGEIKIGRVISPEIVR